MPTPARYEGLRSFDKAVALDTTVYESDFHLGRMLFKLGRQADAESSFAAVVQNRDVAYDPHLAGEMARRGRVSPILPRQRANQVRCDRSLVPIVPAAEGMTCQRELNLIPEGRVFANVSRGKVVDSDALAARL